jgi:hypothetical protein
MNRRTIIRVTSVVMALGLVVLYWLFGRSPAPTDTAVESPMAAAPQSAVAPLPWPPPPQVAPTGGDAPSRIADRLNAADGDIRRDLEIVSELFAAWQSNFPREGNPVGDNAEITAALAGKNRLGFAFIPRNHPAIDAQGELCDRWGTPFRLHQASGTLMEIRSAGPDRKFATADDAQWPAEPAR